jgi:geranylgeranyl diphosphate synthase type 3
VAHPEELLNLHRGQGMDLFWRDNLRCPSTEDYLEMVSNSKCPGIPRSPDIVADAVSETGGLFRLAIKLMQASSTSSEDYVSLVNYIGLIYQVRDDYMNLQSSRYHSNKGFCEDLTEGKFSFPIIHSIHNDPNNMQLINILKQRTENEDVKKYAVAYMEKTGAFAYSRTVLAELDQKARGLLISHGGNFYLSQILDKMRVEE